MKQADPPEWQHHLMGIGDGVTRVFASTTRWPIIEKEGWKVYLEPPGTLDRLLAPDDRPAAEGVAVQTNPWNGMVTVVFDEAPPAKYSVYFKFLWQPPRLRGCRIRVKHYDGSTEWAPIEDVMEAIYRR